MRFYPQVTSDLLPHLGVGGDGKYDKTKFIFEPISLPIGIWELDKKTLKTSILVKKTNQPINQLTNQQIN
jgi:hypothetical protein